MFINNFNFSRISLLYESLGSGTISNQVLIIWEPLVNLVNFLARKHHIGLLFFFLQVKLIYEGKQRNGGVPGEESKDRRGALF